MGEVYRATDTNLKRAVALKVLPDAVAGDAERLARFQREAEVLAALNHPNIAQIHGLERSAPSTPSTGPGPASSGQAVITALVMELVDGPTLAEIVAGSGLSAVGSGQRSRPAEGPGPRAQSRQALPLDEALSIATQIASALEAAHEIGVVHRDLKPANVKVRPDGVVKVLDFGLAKLSIPNVSNDPSNPIGFSQLPTISSPAMMTGAGMILGTAAYMSPEQARGKVVDKRADIWAFGCVLYEMLTGRRAFDGEDVTEALAFLITREPDWSALPAATPAAIRALLKGCLEKKSRERVADISTALFVLKDPTTLGDGPAEGPAEAGRYVRGALSAEGGSRPDRSLRRAAVVGAALLLGVFVATTATWVATRPAAPAPARVSRFTIAQSGATALTITGGARDLTIAPDGSRVIYVGNGGAQLFVRAIDALEPVAIFTGAPRGPFVSPDGQWIGFVDGAAVKKVALTGGPAVTLAALEGFSRGAAWGLDDTIVVASATAGIGLRRVAAAGGALEELTKVDRAQGETRHLWPEVLPGGRAVLFTITTLTGGLDAAQVAVLDLQTGTWKVLVRGGSHAQYVQAGGREGGHLVYAAAGTLRAVPFDLTTLEIRGTPVPVVPEVVTTTFGGVDAVVAGDGTLAYVSGVGGGAAPQRTLAWVDRQGRETPIPAPPRAYAYPRLSPDGARVAVEVRDQEWDIWIANLGNTTLTRFSFGPAPDRLPAWTPDGRRIVWSSDREGLANMYWQSADGSGSVERLIQSPNPQYASAISPDGTRLVFRQDTATRDLMVVALDAAPPQADPGLGQPAAPRQAQPLVQTPFIETSPEISPDGRWIAYQSDESGQDEIYVRPFPDVNAGRWQVSTGGGTKPLWARSGEELFYLVQAGAGAAVMSAPLTRGAGFVAGTPTKVLEGPYYFGTAGAGDAAYRTYDVSADGRRFLMIKEAGDQTATPASLIVVLNWVEELKRLVPTTPGGP